MKNFCHFSLPGSSNPPTSFTLHVVVLITSLDISYLCLGTTTGRRVLYSLAHLFIVPQKFIHKLLWTRCLQRPRRFGDNHCRPPSLSSRSSQSHQWDRFKTWKETVTGCGNCHKGNKWRAQGEKTIFFLWEGCLWKASSRRWFMKTWAGASHWNCT